MTSAQVTSERKPRPAARILLTDPLGRVLLFRFTPPDRAPFWVTPGGAVDPGETYEQAAVRELFEETGLSLDCGPQIAQRVVEFRSLEGADVTADERYFAVRSPHDRILCDGHTQLEQSVMRSWRWFTKQELAALDEPYFPAELVQMLDAYCGIEEAE